MTDEQIVASWDTTGDYVHGYAVDTTYALVPTHTVPSETREAAEAGIKAACALLSIPRPKLVLWLEPEGPAARDYRATYGTADWLSFRYSDVRGIVHRKGHAVGIRADLKPNDALETGAHECAHLIQPDGRNYLEQDEPEAVEFGLNVREALDWRPGTRVHQWAGYPQSGKTLAGEAEFRDRLVANDGSRPRLFWNGGSRMSPHWHAWHLDLAALAGQ